MKMSAQGDVSDVSWEMSDSWTEEFFLHSWFFLSLFVNAS